MKKELKACVITVFLSILLLTNAMGQTKCLVAHYPLDGNAKDIYASKNGTLYGTTPTTDRFGRPNSALKFNGTSDWVKLGTDADFKERTISLWFKVDTFLTGGKYSLVFTTDNSNLKYGGTGFAIDNSGGNNRISAGAGINVLRYTNGIKNVWYHAALVVNSTHIKVFINGQLFDSTLNNSLSHSNDGDTKAHLGCNRNSNALFFKGAIDDAKIYDCALSNAEIDALYKEKIVCPVAFYNLDGDAKDASGNNRNGTLYGTSSSKNRYGDANSALKFNGKSDWVKLGTDADLSERTISLWFQVDTFIGNGDFGLVFTTDNANLQYGGTGLAVDNVGGYNRISTGVGVNILRYTDAVPNKWYHYALVVNSSYFKFFLDGKLIDSMANSYSHSMDGDNYAHLGCSRKNDRYFKGSIDDVKIYNCALSNAEIQKMAHVDTCKAYYTITLDTTQKFKLFLINKSTNSSTTTYLWDLGDSTYSTKRNPRHNFNSFGKFKVCLTVTNGLCSSTFCDTIGLDSNGKLFKKGVWELISVDEGEPLTVSKVAKSKIKVYPNPANNIVTLEFAEGVKGIVGFYNIHGQKVLEHDIDRSQSDINIDTLAPGIYTLLMDTGSGNASAKFVKL